MLFSAILTIFISCIGLFGLSVLAAEKRTKEIGIRKVLGASVSRCGYYFIKRFCKAGCYCIAGSNTGTWLAADKWLQNYPYRITLKLVDVCRSRYFGRDDCIGNGKFPGNKGSDGKSGEEFKNRIIV